MKKKLFLVLLILSLLLCACAHQDGNRTNQDSSDKSEEQKQWEIQEISLPDTEDGLPNTLADTDSLPMEILYGVHDRNVYRIVRTCDENLVSTGICIQMLTTPYTEWKQYDLPSAEWENVTYGFAREASIGKDGVVQLLLSNINEDGVEQYYSGKWMPDSTETISIEKLSDIQLTSEQVAALNVYYVDSRNRSYFVSEEAVWYLDESGQFREWAGKGHILQVTESVSADEEIYLCGITEEGFFGIWSPDSPNALITLEEQKGNAMGKVVFTSQSQGYICTPDSVWTFHLSDGKTECLFTFPDFGYQLDQICSVSLDEQGRILCLAKIEEGYALLCLGEEGTMETASDNATGEQNQAEGREEVSIHKEEIELAVAYPSALLKENIVAFNRAQEDYQIVLRKPGNGESYEDFCTKIATEINSGGGPALLAEDVIDMRGALAQGLLRDLTSDFAIWEDTILPNVWDCGREGEIQYAIPYSFSVETLVASKKTVGEQRKWSTAEMMQIVETSGSGIAIGNLDSSQLFEIMLRKAGMVDRNRKTCYLEDDRAKQLLEFAAAYGTANTDEKLGEHLATGEVPLCYMSFAGLSFFQGMEAVFQGQANYIGLPVDDGTSGNIAKADMLAVNNACDNPEGAISFIQFLISEDCQNQYAKEASANGVNGFPVTRQSAEKMFDYAREAEPEEDEMLRGANFMGYDYIAEPFSESELQKIEALLDSAQPCQEESGEISALILEETQAYFAGQKSADETLHILQNRVQLYLEEMR